MDGMVSAYDVIIGELAERVSKRRNMMSEMKVKIVRLAPMRVASIHGYGSSPEIVAMANLHAWADASGRQIPGRRVFGFNNPDPSPGSPNYGYEFWAELAEGETAGEGVEEKSFSGGLYAVTRVVGIPEITPTWKRLVAWMEDSPYELGRHQWLEEHVAGTATQENDLTLDLYLPIED